MEIVQFVITVVLVTVSGALAPGPLFFATLSQGSQSGTKTGIIFSLSHTIIEFSLIMCLAVGLLTVANEQFVKQIIGISGGVVLIIFGFIQLKNAITRNIEENKPKVIETKRLFLLGMVLTGLNPYFIIWWLTVGAQLILLSLEFASFIGVIFMYVCHVWMDYVWLISISYFAKKGSNMLAMKWYQPLIGIFSVILVYFGVQFIVDATGILS